MDAAEQLGNFAYNMVSNMIFGYVFLVALAALATWRVYAQYMEPIPPEWIPTKPNPEPPCNMYDDATLNNIGGIVEPKDK